MNKIRESIRDSGIDPDQQPADTREIDRVTTQSNTTYALKQATDGRIFVHNLTNKSIKWVGDDGGQRTWGQAQRYAVDVFTVATPDDSGGEEATMIDMQMIGRSVNDYQMGRIDGDQTIDDDLMSDNLREGWTVAEWADAFKSASDRNIAPIPDSPRAIR